MMRRRRSRITTATWTLAIAIVALLLIIFFSISLADRPRSRQQRRLMLLRRRGIESHAIDAPVLRVVISSETNRAAAAPPPRDIISVLFELAALVSSRIVLRMIDIGWLLILLATAAWGCLSVGRRAAAAFPGRRRHRANHSPPVGAQDSFNSRRK